MAAPTKESVLEPSVNVGGIRLIRESFLNDDVEVVSRMKVEGGVQDV